MASQLFGALLMQCTVDAVKCEKYINHLRKERSIDVIVNTTIIKYDIIPCMSEVLSFLSQPLTNLGNGVLGNSPLKFKTLWPIQKTWKEFKKGHFQSIEQIMG